MLYVITVKSPPNTFYTVAVTILNTITDTSKDELLEENRLAETIPLLPHHQATN